MKKAPLESQNRDLDLEKYPDFEEVGAFSLKSAKMIKS